MHLGSQSPQEILQRTPRERRFTAEVLAERLHAPISVLGIIFLLVVIGQSFARQGSQLAVVFEVVAWTLWAIFVMEFLARMVIAPSTKEFWRRNWWQTIFLLTPFLRFLSLLWAVRAARAGRVVAAAVRSTRSARSAFTSRVSWLAAGTVIVVLAGSQLLFEFADYPTYASALHDTAFTVISGQPLTATNGFADVLEIVLALYSVVVFAALAGSLGAYFVQHQREVSEVESGEGV